jgi:hypothetical protein
VIPLGLLGVVVQQLFDAGLDESDLGKDLVGRGGPDERFGVAVPMGDVVVDPPDQDLDRTERATTNRLTGDDPEPGGLFTSLNNGVSRFDLRVCARLISLVSRSAGCGVSRLRCNSSC